MDSRLLWEDWLYVVYKTVIVTVCLTLCLPEATPTSVVWSSLKWSPVEGEGHTSRWGCHWDPGGRREREFKKVIAITKHQPHPRQGGCHLVKIGHDNMSVDISWCTNVPLLSPINTDTVTNGDHINFFRKKFGRLLSSIICYQAVLSVHPSNNLPRILLQPGKHLYI